MNCHAMNSHFAAYARLMCFMILGHLVRAQPVSVLALPVPVPLPAVENVLIFPKGDSAYMPFFHKMDGMLFEGVREEINIVHLLGHTLTATQWNAVADRGYCFFFGIVFFLLG